MRLPPAQWTSLPSWLWGLIPPCGAEAFMVRPELVLFSLSLCFPLSPGWYPCLREGGVLKLEGARVTSWLISSAERSELSPDNSWVCSLGTCSCFLALLRHSLGCKSLLSLTADHSPKTLLPPLFRDTSQGRQGPTGLSEYWGMRCDGDGAAAFRHPGFF